MKFLRMLAIGGVYLLACGGWAVLGTTTSMRASRFGDALGRDVEVLWGGPLSQDTPELSVDLPGGECSRKVRPSASLVKVKLSLEHRRRGLVWHPTFVYDFDGAYKVTNREEVAQKVHLLFKFPRAEGTYEEFSFRVDGKPVDLPVNTAEGIREVLEVAPGRTREFAVGYRTRGMREWRYRPASPTGRVQNLDLAVTTDFQDIDFPEGTLSPMAKEKTASGMKLTWKASDLITRQDVGVVMPEKLNPGPLSARMTYFAPVCLLFFFVLIGTINIVIRAPIHPMHYLFVAAGFFAFHLLFAYMVDHVNVHMSFAASAVTAVALVTWYLHRALGKAFPWKAAAAGQVFYLVLFSYTFFLKGLTGLTVTVGSILTLAVLMAVTARTDWFGLFGGARARRTRPEPKAPGPADEAPAAGGVS